MLLTSFLLLLACGYQKAFENYEKVEQAGQHGNTIMFFLLAFILEIKLKKISAAFGLFA
jgi:hypothetical protein